MLWRSPGPLGPAWAPAGDVRAVLDASLWFPVAARGVGRAEGLTTGWHALRIESQPGGASVTAPWAVEFAVPTERDRMTLAVVDVADPNAFRAFVEVRAHDAILEHALRALEPRITSVDAFLGAFEEFHAGRLTDAEARALFLPGYRDGAGGLEDRLLAHRFRVATRGGAAVRLGTALAYLEPLRVQVLLAVVEGRAVNHERLTLVPEPAGGAGWRVAAAEVEPAPPSASAAAPARP